MLGGVKLRPVVRRSRKGVFEADNEKADGDHLEVIAENEELIMNEGAEEFINSIV